MDKFETPPGETEESGVHSRLPTSRAHRLVGRWSALQPRAHQEPDAQRALHREVGALLESCMTKLMALGTVPDDDPRMLEFDQLLDASYILERLEWCILHGAPYVDRPRAAG